MATSGMRMAGADDSRAFGWLSARPRGSAAAVSSSYQVIEIVYGAPLAVTVRLGAWYGAVVV